MSGRPELTGGRPRESLSDQDAAPEDGRNEEDLSVLEAVLGADDPGKQVRRSASLRHGIVDLVQLRVAE